MTFLHHLVGLLAALLGHTQGYMGSTVYFKGKRRTQHCKELDLGGVMGEYNQNTLDDNLKELIKIYFFKECHYEVMNTHLPL